MAKQKPTKEEAFKVLRDEVLTDVEHYSVITDTSMPTAYKAARGEDHVMIGRQIRLVTASLRKKYGIEQPSAA